MSTRDKRKCFTFTWTVENISYNCQKEDKSIESPSFVINVEQESKCFLKLYLEENSISLLLVRSSVQSLNQIECELAFLSKDGKVIKSQKRNNVAGCTCLFLAKKEIFVIYRSAYLAEDKLTARCRIWKSDRELTENVQCFARTRICIKREAFLWNIQNFSSLHSEEKCTYQIKSMPLNEVLMSFDLLLKNPYTDEDSINIQPVSENGKIKYCVLHLMPLNGLGSANQGLRKEFLFSDNIKPKLFTLPFSKNDLVARKDLCLPNDVLSLRCECTYTTGDIIEEIESVINGCEKVLHPIRPDNQRFDEESTSSVSKRILNDDLKFLFHDNLLSDVKLKTNTKTFQAHKNILSARSPVFKAMFSNNMKEKLTDCVEIEDIDSETVFRMLLYVYTAEIQELQCENACELYRAADRYQILALRDECSAYIKYNLSPINACEVLILADMYQDEDLKASVQEFIFNHDVLNSEAWKHLMKNHAKIAADTMYLQIQSSSKFLVSKFSAIDQLFGNGSARINSVSTEFGSLTTKITSTSPALNSITAAAAGTTFKFNPPTGVDTMMRGGELRVEDYAAKHKGDSTIGVTRFPTPPAQQTSIFGSSFSNFSFGGNHSDSFFGTTGTKKFTDGFGMKSDWKPLAVPQLSSIPKTETAYPGFNSSGIKIPSARKVFNFSATEKSSFGNNGQKIPVKPSFSFGNISEKEQSKLSFSVNSNDKKEPVKPSFLFGNSSKKEPVKASFLLDSNKKEFITSSFSFGNTSEKEHPKLPISLGSSDKKGFVTPSFLFGNISEKEPTKPSFLFGNCKEKEPVKSSFLCDSSDKKEFVAPSFSFGNISEKEPIKPSFSFGNISEKEPIKPSFSFGSCREKEPVKLSFLFDSSDKREPVNPSSTFQNRNEKESVKPCLTFGSSDEKKPAKQSFASSDAKESVQQSFSFGFHPFTAEKEPINKSLSQSSSDVKKPVNSSFSFSNSGEKEPVKPSFLFSSSSEKEPVQQSFSFGFHPFTAEKEPIKNSLSQSSSDVKKPVNSSFSFANSGEKEPVKPSFSFSSSSEKEPIKSFSFEKGSVKLPFSFSSSDDKEQVKSSLSVINSSEKKLDKQSFLFSSSDEKESVNRSFSLGNSCAVALSSSSGFNNGTGQENPEFPRLENSSTVTTCASVSAHMNSVQLVFNDSNAKTSSASLGFKNMSGDSPTETRVVSSIVETSTALNGINSTVPAKPSKKFFSFDSISVKASSSSSGFSRNNEAISHTSSVETPVSSTEKTSEIDSTCAKIPSESTGYGSNSSNTPATSGIDNASAKIPSELDITSAETSTSTGCDSSFADKLATSGISSSNAKILSTSSELDCAIADSASASTGCGGSSPDTPVTSGVDSASAKIPSASSELDCTSIEKSSTSAGLDINCTETTEFPKFDNTYAMTSSASGFDSTNGSTLPASHEFDSIPAETNVCSGFNIASSETKYPPLVLDCNNRGTFTTSELKPSYMVSNKPFEDI